MNKILCKKLTQEEITISLFSRFNRFQKVTRCWRKERGEWLLKDIAFTEQWSQNNYEYLVSCLQKTLQTGGKVIGAFNEEYLVGFASVENVPFGSK